MTKKLFLVLAILITFALLTGCSGIRFHDESKALVSSGIKAKYAQTNILDVIDVEKKNLDNLLSEELKIIHYNHTLQVDFALLSIADNNSPMADTYNVEAIKRLEDLGYKGGFKDVRMLLMEGVDQKASEDEKQINYGLLKQFGIDPPECDALTSSLGDSELEKVTGQVRKEAVAVIYQKYKKACEELQELQESQILSLQGGLIKNVYYELKFENVKIDKHNQLIIKKRKKLEKKRKAYNEAVKAFNDAKSSGDELELAIKNRAKDLESVIDEANELDLGIVSEERTKAILTLLTVAAGGKPDNYDKLDPEIKKAINIAEELPSLAGDLKGLVDQARAPSASNLLIEMNHQVLLVEYAKQLRTFAEQKVDILKAKYDALIEESKHWLKFGDAICNYAVLSAGEEFPGQRSDDFSVEQEVKDVGVDGKKTKIWVCKLEGTPLVKIENCILGKPWNENIINEAALSSAAKRELYKALAAYLQALALQAKPREQDFRFIDVLHRETLVARESAIKGWDNLVAVPINQIDAYYQAGLKPAEIADLIVKALGLTAITVGVIAR